MRTRDLIVKRSTLSRKGIPLASDGQWWFVSVSRAGISYRPATADELTPEQREVEDMVECSKCGARINHLAVFPGGICVRCHEMKFNAEVARNGGRLPRPDFTKVIAR